jgi:hypothetical protein
MDRQSRPYGPKSNPASGLALCLRPTLEIRGSDSSACYRVSRGRTFMPPVGGARRPRRAPRAHGMLAGPRRIRYFFFIFLLFFERFSNLNKYEISKNFKYEQIWNLNIFQICTKIEIWFFSNLNKIRNMNNFKIWTKFESDQFSNLNKIQNLNNFQIWTKFDI